MRASSAPHARFARRRPHPGPTRDDCRQAQISPQYRCQGAAWLAEQPFCVTRGKRTPSQRGQTLSAPAKFNIFRAVSSGTALGKSLAKLLTNMVGVNERLDISGT